MKNKQNTRRGFTLMELLVVLVIVIILTTAAWHSYAKVQEKARISEILVLLKPIAVAQRLYYQTHDNWATSFDDLDINMLLPPDTNGTFGGKTYHNITDTRSNKFWSLQLEGSKVFATRLGGDYQGGGLEMVLGEVPQMYCIEKLYSVSQNKYCAKFFKGTDKRQAADYWRYTIEQ